MNDKIKQLVEQCTTISRFSYEGTGGGYNTEYFDKEKFAELIWKEAYQEGFDAGCEVTTLKELGWVEVDLQD